MAEDSLDLMKIVQFVHDVDGELGDVERDLRRVRAEYDELSAEAGAGYAAVRQLQQLLKQGLAKAIEEMEYMERTTIDGYRWGHITKALRELRDDIPDQAEDLSETSEE